MVQASSLVGWLLTIAWSGESFTSAAPASGCSEVTLTVTETTCPMSTSPLPSSSLVSSLIRAQSLSGPEPSASSSCAFWLGDVKHQGIAAFNRNAYSVFRNVRDFGAKGDGVTDDTNAINNAITAGARCGPGSCGSSTTTPAVVYFPPGTYIVSRPIVPYYYTMMIGNAKCLPVLKPNAAFTGGAWIIDANPYQPGGSQGWGSTNVFWRQIRNFVIDYSSLPPQADITGIHWPTGQATSIQNVIFNMKVAPNTNHVGIFIENGSGGFIGDLTFNGGKKGLYVGNQQFTMRGLTFNSVQIAIDQIWNWGFTYQGLSINNCGIGISMTSRNPNTNLQTVGSMTIIDSSITNTGIGFSLTWGNIPNNSSYVPGTSVIIENVALLNVPVAIRDQTGTVLQGSTGAINIAAWGQGHTYTPTGRNILRGSFTPNVRFPSMLKGNAYYTRPKPQYIDNPAASILSVRDSGARGDGTTDDTAAVQNAISIARNQGRVLFFDHGTYKVTGTIYVPAGSRLTGEAFPVIMSAGPFFNDLNNPKPVIKVGNNGETGTVEWSDMIISGQGAQAGAVLIEWNVISKAAAPSGMWDVHTRVGGFAGSDLQVSQCPKTPGVPITAATLNRNCIAAFASMRITTRAAYLLMENVWLWVADHDIEHRDLTQITIYAGRGLLLESNNGPIWLYGTSVEHHDLYEYNLQSAGNVVAGYIQTESAYMQPNPPATIPFPLNSGWQDPYINGNPSTGLSTLSGWGLAIGNNSQNINIYGAGLYSFFSDYNVICSNEGNGQYCQERTFLTQPTGRISVYNLNTVGTTNMISQLQPGGKSLVDLAKYSDNRNGFANTIAVFRPRSS